MVTVWCTRPLCGNITLHQILGNGISREGLAYYSEMSSKFRSILSAVHIQLSSIYLALEITVERLLGSNIKKIVSHTPRFFSRNRANVVQDLVMYLS